MALLRNHYPVSCRTSFREEDYEINPFPITHELIKEFLLDDMTIECKTEHEYMTLQYFLFQNGYTWNSGHSVIASWKISKEKIIRLRVSRKMFGAGSLLFNENDAKFTDYFRPLPQATGILASKRLGL